MTQPPSRVPPAERLPWWPVFAVGALALATWSRPSPAKAPAGSPAIGKGSPAGSGAARAGTGEEPGRGRQADSPAEIPVRGWKDVLWRVYGGINDDRLLAVAAGVTFYALLALFPAIAALVSLYGLFANPADIAKQLDALGGILPGGAIDVIGGEVKRLAAAPSGSLSLALATSLAISLWSANAGMKAVFDALNVAYQEKEKRSFIALNLRSLTFTLGAVAILILALASVVVLPVVFKFLGFGSAMDWVLTLLRWPVLFAAVTGGLALLYRYGPSRAVARWRWILWGSAVAAVLWLVASMLFSFYVGHFGSYNATYGSLGSAIGFMTWLWISSIVVLVGAELSGEMEHQTHKDTTTGQPKPEGARGARMADQVGAAAD